MPWEFLCRIPLPSPLSAHHPCPALASTSPHPATASGFAVAVQSTDHSTACSQDPSRFAPSATVTHLQASAPPLSSSPASPEAPDEYAPAQQPSPPTLRTTPDHSCRCSSTPRCVGSIAPASDSDSASALSASSSSSTAAHWPSSASSCQNDCPASARGC